MNIPQIIIPTAVGYLGCFQFGATKNSAAMNILINIFGEQVYAFLLGI